jgi:hypothetical protein
VTQRLAILHNGYWVGARQWLLGQGKRSAVAIVFPHDRST